ncbi:MAG: ATP-binding protein [bacterium]
MQDNPARRLSILYNSIAFVSALVFLVVFIVLFFRQNSLNRDHALDVANKLLLLRATSADYLITDVAEDVLVAKAWAEKYLSKSHGGITPSRLYKRIRYNSDENYFSLDGTLPPGEKDYGNVYGSGSLTGRSDDFYKELNMSLRLFGLEKIFHYAPPMFKWSLYYSRNGFTTIYPHINAEKNKEVFTPPKIVKDIFKKSCEQKNSITDSTEVNTYRGKSMWSDVHLDVFREAQIVSNVIPVFDEDGCAGALSIEIDLSFLNKSVNNTDYPNVKILVINKGGQVLALTGQNLANESRVVKVKDVLPSAVVKVIPTLFGERKSEIKQVDGYYIFSTPLKAAGWVMVKVLPESDLKHQLLPDVIYRAILFAIMFALLFAAHIFVRHCFVSPAISFVDYVWTEAVGGTAPVPTTPSTWKQWFLKVSDLLALKSVSANLPGAIIQFRRSPDGNITIPLVSAGITDLIGLAPGDLMEYEKFAFNVLPKDKMKGLLEIIDRSSKDMTAFSYESAVRSADGVERWLRFIARPRHGEKGEIIWDGVILDISDRKKAEDELKQYKDHLEELVASRTKEIEKINEELKNEIQERICSESALKTSEEKLRGLSRQVLSIQDEERARLSRELHDDIGQQLAAIMFQLVSLKEKGAVAVKDIALIEEMINRAGSDLHKICQGLQPMTLSQFGFEPAIKMLLWDLMEKHGRTILSSFESMDYNVSDAVGMSIYRICQEAVTNSIRHSGADQISVSFRLENNELVLEVRDNGKGFEMDDLKENVRLGIVGMKQRADLCGGRLSIDSVHGKGTCVYLRIPIDNNSGGID